MGAALSQSACPGKTHELNPEGHKHMEGDSSALRA